MFVNVSCTVPLRGDAAMDKTEGAEKPQRPQPRARAVKAPSQASKPAPASIAAGGPLPSSTASELDRDALLDVLRNMDPNDLKDLLQGMKRFPWEVDNGAQTDESLSNEAQLQSADAHAETERSKAVGAPAETDGSAAVGETSAAETERSKAVGAPAEIDGSAAVGETSAEVAPAPAPRQMFKPARKTLRFFDEAKVP